MTKEAFTTIDGVDFSLVHYEHDEGFDLLLTLAKVAMPSLVDVIRESPSLDAFAAAFSEAGGIKGLLASVHLLPSRLQAEGGSAMFGRFFSGVFAIVDGEEKGRAKTLRRRMSEAGVRNEVIGLRFGLTLRLLTWVIRENFSPFLTELGEALELASTKPEHASTESQTSDAER